MAGKGLAYRGLDITGLDIYGKVWASHIGG